jgi:hypothetical protein
MMTNIFSRLLFIIFNKNLSENNTFIIVTKNSDSIQIVSKHQKRFIF